MKAIILNTIALLFCISTSIAQTWTGNISSAWNNSSNWNPMIVPGTGSTVTINSAVNVPQLPSNMSLSTLTINSGGGLSMAGFTLTIGSSVAINTANITGGGNITILNAGSTIINSSTINTALTIKNFTSTLNLLNNTITGNTYIKDSSTQGGNNYIDGNLINGNFELIHCSSAQLYEGYGGSTGNHVTGNVVLTNKENGTGFHFGYSHPMIIDGNLNVNHNNSGSVYIYETSGSVGGNINITNNGGGLIEIGNMNSNVPVGGTVNITSSSCPNFKLHRIKNTTSGGVITVSDPSVISIQRDTILASLSISNYSSTFNFLNNSITGNTTLSSSSTQSSTNYFGGNLITGNLSVTHNTSNSYYDGFGGSTNNHITGNASFLIQNAGSGFRNSYSLPTNIDGNLTVNHNTSGSVYLFEKPSNVGGNLSVSCTGGGSLNIGDNTSVSTQVTGTVSVNASSISSLSLIRIINATNGGNINIQNPTTVNFSNDSLKSPVTITNYRSTFNFNNNEIQGDVSLADSSIQTSNNYISNNTIQGNLTLTHKSNNPIYEGYPSSNQISGNTTFNILNGATGFRSSYNAPSSYGGNLTVNHASAGSVYLFETGGTVTGNFVLNSTNNGFLQIGHTSVNSYIDGTCSIYAYRPTGFLMNRVLNQTSGGNINIVSPGTLQVQRDTIQSAISIQNYYGSFEFLRNEFQTTNLSDSTSQNTTNYFSGNHIIGDLSHIHRSGAHFYEGYGTNTSNLITGNVNFSVIDSGSNLHLSYAYPILINGNLTVSHSTVGSLDLFRTGTQIDGNFALTSSMGGAIEIGQPSYSSSINGTININCNLPSSFYMRKVKNNTIGGSVTLTSPNVVEIRKDSIKAIVSITNYNGSMNFIDNQIQGSTTLSDANTHNSTNYLAGNFIDGNFYLTHNGISSMLEGYSGSTNSEITGDAEFTSNGSGTMVLGYSLAPKFQKNITLTSYSGSAIDVSKIIFTGSNDGHVIQGGSAPLSFHTSELNKTSSGKLYLDHPVVVNSTFAFTSGYLISSPSSSLIFKSGTTYSNASDSSHVMGSVTKIGNTTFTFPLGNGTALQTLNITAPTSVTDTFRTTIVLKHPDADGYSIAFKDGSIHSIAPYHYWNVEQLSGTSNVGVTLGWGPPCTSAGITDLPSLTVSRWNGSLWSNLGNILTTGTAASGTVRQVATSSNFGPFALATSTNLNTWTITSVSASNSSVCSGAPTTLTASGGVSYTWQPGNMSGNSVVVNPLTTTTYTVTGTSASGCLTTATKTITVFGLPPLSTTATAVAICTGGSTTITASGSNTYTWQPGNLSGASVTVSPSVTTTYTVTGVSLNGCTQSAIRTITVGVCASCDTDIIITASPYTILLTESTTFIETNGIVNIDSGAYVKFDAAPTSYVLLKPGFFAKFGSVFIAQALNGCSAGSPQMPANKENSAALTQENHEGIFLYPNPTSGKVTIITPSTLKEAILYDLMGNKLKVINLSGSLQSDIDIGNLPNGVYILKAQGYTNIKIIKN